VTQSFSVRDLTRVKESSISSLGVREQQVDISEISERLSPFFLLSTLDGDRHC